MSGRSDFTTLTQEFTPKRRARVDSKKEELRSAMALHEVRHASFRPGDGSRTRKERRP